MNPVDEMREALAQVGIPTEKLGDEEVIAATRALFEACANFGAALQHIFADAAKQIGERFRRLAEFADEIERLAEAEKAGR